jgi:hypothetical protein
VSVATTIGDRSVSTPTTSAAQSCHLCHVLVIEITLPS